MDRKSRTSRSAHLSDTNEEVSLWKQICIALARLETIQRDTATVVNSINGVHTAVNLSEGIPSSIQGKLKDYYKGGIELSNNEAKIIHDIIEKISVLVALRDASEYHNGIEQKRKKRKAPEQQQQEEEEEDETLEQVSKKSKINHHGIILSQGTSVAAKQKDRDEEWILAVVISYHSDKNKYQVEDVDQDEFGQKQRYMLQPRNIIPIPNSEEAKGLEEMTPGQHVLALYPGTTCFYRARILAPPSKNKDSSYTGTYKIQFEDDNNQVKYVMPGHVLQVPKAK